MTTYLDDIHEAMASIRSVSQNLEYLARAFDTVGNRQVSKELESLAEYLMEDQKKIGDAISTDINMRLDDSHRFAGNMLESILNNCERANGERK